MTMAGAAPDVEVVFADPPERGDWQEVADGVFWISITLPFSPHQVNAWALLAHDGWVLVDTGPDTPEARQAWDALFARALAGKPVRQIVATHGHLDHVGLAGHLVARTGASFAISLTEWLLAEHRRSTMRDGLDPLTHGFFTSHGCGHDVLELLHRDAHAAGRLLRELPPVDTCLDDGRTIQLGQHAWRTIVGGGHTAQNVSLHCEALNVLISGDQVLPRITPFVGLNPFAPEADPLADYLASFSGFGDMADDVLVLPGHGVPFRRLDRRLDAIRCHHEKRLNLLLDALTTPKTGWQLAEHLFGPATRRSPRLTLLETLAHLNFLFGKGEADRFTGADGTVLWLGRSTSGAARDRFRHCQAGSTARRTPAVASPDISVRPEGADHQWRRVPPRQ